MKKIVLAAALFAMPGIAHAADLAPNMSNAVDGFFEAAVTSSKYGYWGDTYEPWLGGSVASAVNYQTSSSLGVGFDVRGWGNVDDYYDGYYSIYGTQAAMHLNYQGEASSLGLFGGAAITNGYYNSGSDIDVFAGIEGKTSLSEQFILSGQLGYIDNPHSYYPFDNAKFAQISLAYFPMDNLKLEATVAGLYGQVGDSSGEDAKTLTYTLEAAYQFEGTPLSVFTRYTTFKDYDYFGDTGIENNSTLSIGASFSFGDGSLRSRSAKVNQAMSLETLSWLRIDGY